MPNIAEDNPAEAGRALLGVLSDEELARYGEIARDQAALELNRWWFQVVLAAGSLAALVWAGNIALSVPAVDGMWRRLALALGLFVALGYWPYRRAKNWTLWKGHVKAVGAEQDRRRGDDNTA